MIAATIIARKRPSFMCFSPSVRICTEYTTFHPRSALTSRPPGQLTYGLAKRNISVNEEARMRTRILFLLAVVFLASVAGAQTRAANTLGIYVIDVEGGNAVLFATPSGESVLVDTGNGGDGAVRDAARIMAAARDAGVQSIDHLIITHYHGDHIGGLSELATHGPIKEFIDHGTNNQPTANIDPVLQRYAELYAKAKHTVAKPGDKIPVSGLDWRIVAAAGEVLKTPLPGAGRPNPYCASFKAADVPKTEDDQSVGSI